jgi:hypothetical protein
MATAHTPNSWFQALILDVTECAWARPRPQKSLGNAGPLTDTRVLTSHNSSGPSRPRQSHSPRLFEPYPAFFEGLARLVVDEPQLARTIDDDKTSSLVWGPTYTLRSRFLQMCIRDQHMKCVELWWKLDERSRQELIEVYRNGGASPGYFYDIMVNQSDSHERWDQQGSSDNDSASFSSRHAFTFR